MTSPDIPTPETDVEQRQFGIGENRMYISADFARDLERRLAAATADAEAARKEAAIAREPRRAYQQVTEKIIAGLRSELAAATARAEKAERERDEAIATFDAIDYYRLKVAEAGYRGSFGFEAFVADPGGHYQEERQRVVGHGPSPMQALRNGLKTLGSTQTKTIQLRSEMRKERDNLRAELDRLRKEREFLQARIRMFFNELGCGHQADRFLSEALSDAPKQEEGV